MENNPKKIDTKGETVLALFKTALKKRNFWKVTVWLSIISASLIVFFLNGGATIIMAIFGKGTAK